MGKRCYRIRTTGLRIDEQTFPAARFANTPRLCTAMYTARHRTDLLAMVAKAVGFCVFSVS